MCSVVERNNPTTATLSQPMRRHKSYNDRCYFRRHHSNQRWSEHWIRCIDRVRIILLRNKSRQMRGIKKNANAKTSILTIYYTHTQQTTPPPALICFVSVSLPLLSFTDQQGACTNHKMNFVRRGRLKKAGTNKKREGTRSGKQKTFPGIHIDRNAKNF